MFTMKSRLRWRWREAIGIGPFFTYTGENERPRRCYLCNRLLRSYSFGDFTYIFKDDGIRDICKRHAIEFGETITNCLTAEEESLIYAHSFIVEKIIWYRDEIRFWISAVWKFSHGLPRFFLAALLYHISRLCTLALKKVEGS